MMQEQKDYGRWTYGDAGDRFPTQEGDIWRVGPHVLACGDLEKGDGARLLQKIVGRPSLFLSDPPWNAGNARAFRTKAGDSRPVDFFSLLTTILDLSRTFVAGLCCLEMGIVHTPRIIRMIEERGGILLHVWDITYYRTKPCKLIAFSWKSIDYGRALSFVHAPVTGLDDGDAFHVVLTRAARPGETVLDPCVGRGLTARVAHEQHKRCVGLELHPRRLACAVAFLADTGLPALKETGALYDPNAGGW